jgi:hypothetical protein
MRKVAYTGLGISLVGAALDFYSGGSYQMGPIIPAAGVMISTPTQMIAPSLYLLGILVLTSGILMVLPRMAGRMRSLGLSMEALGVVMALVSYLAPEMNMGVSYAMLFVGAAMILNGAFMQRREPAMEHK